MCDFCFVVPIYKVPYSLLCNCIESILNQSYTNIELILVEDGSPDKCGEVCDKYAAKDSRVHVVHKKNEGLSEARNTGTRIATSTWITFVDGDDWVDPDFVESFMSKVKSQKEHADFYIYNGYRNYSGKEVVCTPYYNDEKRFITYTERESLQKECCLVPTRNNGNQLFIGSGWAKVYRLSFLRDNNLFFTIVPYGEDSIFFMYSVEKASIIEYVSKPVYHYRDTEGGMVNGFRFKADEEQEIYLKELFQFAKIYNKSSDFVDTLYYRVFISLQRVISQKFYNKQYSKNSWTKYYECKKYCSIKPFSEIFSHIKFSNLNRNSKIKYVIIRLQLFALFRLFRNTYLNLQNMTSQSRYNEK